MSKAPVSDLPGFRASMVVSTGSLRKLMLGNGFEWRCYECGITEWRGVKAPLHIDHIDGVRSNNLKSNLRFLCPNCHALTDTYAGRNVRQLNAKRMTKEEVVDAYHFCKGEHGVVSASSILRQLGKYPRTYWVRFVKDVLEAEGLTLSTNSELAAASRSFNGVAWPCDETLKGMLDELPREEVGKLIGVSGNAVKKRCMARGIPEPDTYRMSPRKRRSEMEIRSAQEERLKTMHGTVTGYMLELSLGIPTCDECRSANARKCGDNRKRRRDRKSMGGKC